jgi:hypothetical protein
MGKKAVDRASVYIGAPKNLEGFGLALDIKVEGVDEELLNAGQSCPLRLTLKVLALAVVDPS